jgi:biotin carboxylase
MNARVLVGFANALAGIESAWCLARDGFEVHAFARRGSRPALGRSRSVRVVDVTPPEENALECSAEIAAIARELGAAAVLPLDDHAVWLCDRALGTGGPTVVAGPTGRLARLALDKREQLQLAESAGLAVPASADADEPPPGDGPWMVKSALAVELRGTRLHRPSGRIAADPGQVTEIAVAMGGPVIVQSLIDGVGEGVFGLAVPGAAAALSGHRRIRMMNPQGSGSSACRSVPVAADVTGAVQGLISHSGWRGLFMVELLRDAAGKPWFMELNGRAWGSMALARHRGYRYPSWAVRSALDPQFVPAEPPEPPDVTARHLGRELIHLGTVLARGGAPRLATVRDVLTVRRSDRWYNYRRGEAGVFVCDTWATVRAQASPKISAAASRIPWRSG